jgi:hypothetical protein
MSLHHAERGNNVGPQEGTREGVELGECSPACHDGDPVALTPPSHASAVFSRCGLRARVSAEWTAHEERTRTLDSSQMSVTGAPPQLATPPTPTPQPQHDGPGRSERTERAHAWLGDGPWEEWKALYKSKTTAPRPITGAAAAAVARHNGAKWRAAISNGRRWRRRSRWQERIAEQEAPRLRSGGAAPRPQRPPRPLRPSCRRRPSRGHWWRWRAAG